MKETPFESFSNRKSVPFKRLFYEREQWNNSSNYLFDRFTISDSTHPKYVYEFVLNEYKNIDEFKSHVYTYEGDEIQVTWNDFHNLAVGFKKAGRETADNMIKNSCIGDLDTYFFAMVYLYRQSIELLLKASIFKIIVEKNEQKKVLKECAHDLGNLFKKFNGINTHRNLSESQYSWLYEFLKSVSIFDRASDSFRYPFRINQDILGESFNYQYVFKDRKDICLNKLVNKFEIAFSLLQKDLIFDEKKDFEEMNEYSIYSTDFLEEGKHYYSKSVVGKEYNNSRIDMYAEAYKNAADHLFSLTLNDSSNEFANHYFAPIMYLYQNAIELTIKDLCLDSCSNQEALKTIWSEKHNINAIWKVIKSNYSTVIHANIPEEHQLEIERMIETLSEAKINTSTFRYPCDKYLNRNFSNGYSLHIGYVYIFFSQFYCILDDLCHKTKGQIDVLSEFNSQY